MLESRFLLVNVVKGLILLHSEKNVMLMDVSLSQEQIMFASFIFPLNFSCCFLSPSSKAIQLLSLSTSFSLFIRASVVKTTTTTSKQQNKTNLNKKMVYFD